MHRRRDFLKLLAGSAGGLMLSSCLGGGSDDTFSSDGFQPDPNAFRFFSLFDSRGVLPDGRVLDSLPGSVLLNGAGQVLFFGSTTSGMGLYELVPDFEATLREGRGVLRGSSKVLARGDVLPDGTVVQGLGGLASNARGSRALTVRNDQQKRLLLFQPPAGDLGIVATFRTRLPELGIRLGGTFGDLDLNDLDGLLFVDHYTQEGISSPNQGLFLLPEARVGAGARLVRTTLDTLPDADGTMAGIGLIDLNSKGSYVAQVLGPASLVTARGDLPPQGLMAGSVTDSLDSRLLVAPASFRTTMRGKLTPGSVVLGPRLADQSHTTAHVVHESRQDQVLYRDGHEIARVNQTSPGGDTIRGFSAPVLSPDGVLHGIVITEHGHELIRVTDNGSRVLLRRGDAIEGRVVNSIVFGMHSDQVDAAGRLVFVAEFMDGSSAVVLGIPV